MIDGPTYYDVLDVDPDAGSDEIRDAWRAAIAELTPADRRFRLYNRAAEVLLDPERRTAYDAELARQPAAEPATDAEPATATSGHALPATAASLPSAVREGMRRRLGGATARVPGRAVPGWLLVTLGVLTLASVALTSYLFAQPSAASVEDAAASARSAAERAVVPVLSYDYRTLDEDQQAAHRWLTADQEKDYDQLFEVIRDNAPSTRTVVDVEVVSSGIVRAGEERTEVLLFVNRPTTNKAHKEPVVYKDQVTVTMARADDGWLVDDLRTSPVAP